MPRKPGKQENRKLDHDKTAERTPWQIRRPLETDRGKHGAQKTGTLITAEWQYDKFSVDVYAGAFDSFSATTTTDGDFTVTQGKLEGKAMTSLELDGSSDKISSTSF